MANELTNLLTSPDPANVALLIEMVKHGDSEEFIDPEFTKRWSFFKVNSNWGRNPESLTAGENLIFYAYYKKPTPTVRDIPIYKTAIEYGWAWNIAAKENMHHYFPNGKLNCSPLAIYDNKLLKTLFEHFKIEQFDDINNLLSNAMMFCGSFFYAYDFQCYFNEVICKEPCLSVLNFYMADFFEQGKKTYAKEVPIFKQADCIFRSLLRMRSDIKYLEPVKKCEFLLIQHPITKKKHGLQYNSSLKPTWVKNRKSKLAVKKQGDSLIIYNSNLNEEEQKNVIDCFTPCLASGSTMGMNLIFENGK
jgi:hypothetical protein